MIHIDDRKGSQHLAPLLEARGLPVDLARMEFGDAAFNGSGPGGEASIGIELKKLDDLIGSLVTKRFQAHQLPGMLGLYRFPILIVEGMYREAPDGLIERGVRYGSRLNWMRHRSFLTYNQLEGMLYTLMFHTPFEIIKTHDTDHTVAEVARLYRRFQRPWTSHDSHKAIIKAVPVVASSELRDPWFNRDRYFPEGVALQVPGLGNKRAVAASRYFRSVARMAIAGPKTWRNVDGVGPKLAARASEIFKREF